MNQKSKQNTLAALLDYMEENGMNTNTIKEYNPLPVSERWIASLKESVRDGTNKGFSRNKVKKLLDDITYPYKEDGSVLIVEKVSDEQLKKYRAAKFKVSPNGRANGKTER